MKLATSADQGPVCIGQYSHRQNAFNARLMAPSLERDWISDVCDWRKHVFPCTRDKHGVVVFGAFSSVAALSSASV
jgi:hypothetical protein